MIEPKIIALKEKKLVGMKSQMLRHEYGNIIMLWKQFMPQKHLIQNTVNTELIALQEYSNFNNPNEAFDIWACAEVIDTINIPETMEAKTIDGGLYAVFLHKGMNAAATYQRIMTEWLPNTDNVIDDRPHFQVMGDNYKNGSEESEEDFYVPIKLKN
ncbi:MAG: GyrI-like domain-containing protein [Winogradskyella sp.]|uniref:GyrI-like domain-containing protein n=1 Tax=Winogradskyella sp. TaxID=1883156 RepID=UPI0025FDBD4F|nr:GyrI-like domain-containing protein [Winogradskyella sp.]NRB60988.1 GyrI-like domain-containing protein [Winogradskyella sp.]